MKTRNSLVFKFVSLAAIISTVFFSIVYYTIQNQMVAHFRALDEISATTAINRNLDLIQAEIWSMGLLARALLQQDKANTELVEMMDSLSLDFFTISAEGGSFQNSSGLLRVNGEINEISNTGELFQRVLKGPFAEKMESSWGFVISQESSEIYLLSTNSVIKEERSIVIGRLFNTSLSHLMDRTAGFSVDVHQAPRSFEYPVIKMNVEDTRFPAFEVLESDEINYHINEDGMLMATIVVEVPYLENGLLINIMKNPVIWNLGQKKLRKLSISYVAAFVLFLFIMVLWVIYSLSRPLGRLVRGIGTWDGIRLPDMGKLKERNDEIGLLAKTFVQMSGEILSKTKSLEEQAVRDGLTGLFNRRHFDNHLHAEWDRHRRDSKALSVIMADVDHFKAYNDTYGHQAGDDCLRRVARGFYRAIHRPGDIPFRYGGEEFSIVLADTDLDGARNVAEALRSAVSDLEIPHEGSRVSSHITMSFGVASFVPTADASKGILLGKADEALYRAKEAGRNRVEG